MRRFAASVFLACAAAAPLSAQTATPLSAAEQYTIKQCQAVGQADAIIAACTAALAIPGLAAPDKGPLYDSRLTAYLVKGDVDHALSDANAGVLLFPKEPTFFVDRGLVYEKRGKPDLALADYNQAASLDPRDVGIYLARAQLYEGQDKIALALADANTVVRLDPKNVNGFILRAALNAHQGKAGEALADVRQCLNLDPANVPCKSTLDRWTKELAAAAPGYTVLFGRDVTSAVTISLDGKQICRLDNQSKSCRAAAEPGTHTVDVAYADQGVTVKKTIALDARDTVDRPDGKYWCVFVNLPDDPQGKQVGVASQSFCKISLPR